MFDVGWVGCFKPFTKHGYLSSTAVYGPEPPQRRWLEDCFPFETVPFSGEMLVFGGVHFLDCNVFFLTRMWLFGVLGAFCLNKEHETGVSSSYLRIHQRRETSPNRDFPKKVLELVRYCTLTLHGTSPKYPTRLDFFSGKHRWNWCSGTMLCNRWVRRSRPGLLELLGTARCDRDFWFGRL